MPLVVTFKNMDTSETLEKYVRTKISEVFHKFLPSEPQAQVTCLIEHHDHNVHLNFNTTNGHRFNVRASSPSMYTSVDLLVAKLQKQIRRAKDKSSRFLRNQDEFIDWGSEKE